MTGQASSGHGVYSGGRRSGVHDSSCGHPGGFALLATSQLIAQQNRIDAVTPMAPDLAVYGPLAVGVRTITATDRNRVDVLSTEEGGPTARYDRTLTIEVCTRRRLRPDRRPAASITPSRAIRRGRPTCMAAPSATPPRHGPRPAAIHS